MTSNFIRKLTKSSPRKIDSLQYQTFGYDDNEWDNVPIVIPKFNLHLQNYLQALSGVCNEFNERETTMELRKDIESSLADANMKQVQTRHQDLQEKEVINKEATVQKNKLANLYSKFGTFRDESCAI